MNKTFKFLPLVAATAALAGCQDYDLGFDAKEIAFKQNFEKAFGKIDPEQDWNLVAQLANEGAETRAAANKTTPTGDFIITVLPDDQAAQIAPELMKDYSKMLPEIGGSGGTSYDDSNLGRVTQNFSVTTNKLVLYPVYYWTRVDDEIGLYYHSNETGSIPVHVNDGSADGKDYNIVYVPITSSHSTELEYKYEAAPVWTIFYNNTNFDTYVTQYYKEYLVENCGFVLCDGTQYNQYGHPGFTQGKLLKFKKKTTLGYASQAGPAGTEFDEYEEASGYVIVSALAEAFPTLFRCAKDDEYYFCTSQGGTRYASVISNSSCSLNVDPAIEAALDSSKPAINGDIRPTGFRSKGIVVDLPASMEIGFYVKNGDDIMYSEGKLNGKMTWTGHTNEDKCYVATYESNETDAQGNNIRYLAFEDWYGAGDYDLNDIVFRVYGFNDVHDEEETTEEGLLVCEDLGNFDFDFNDVVLKLKWTRRTEKNYTTDGNGVVTGVTKGDEKQLFSITGMAAGGTLRSTVKYGSETVGEIHELLNGTAPNILNAGPDFEGEGQTKTYTLDNSAWNSTTYPNGYISQVFGEGLVTIEVENETSASRILNSTNYKTSGVPQMMLLPINYEWAKERTPISEAYTQFENWVSNVSATSWMSSQVRDNVTKRVVPSAPSSPELPTDGPSEDNGLVLTISPNSEMTFNNTTESQSITASCATDGATISFSSDNEDAATVTNDGVVTPIANGSAIITVTASCDGYESVSKTIHVVVSNYPVNYGTEIAFTQSTKINLPLVTESTSKITFTVLVYNNWASMMMKDGNGGTKIITAEGDEWNNREFYGNTAHTIEITNSEHISLIKSNGIWIEGYMTNNAYLYYKVQ